jgi:hypothetical protein
VGFDVWVELMRVYGLPTVAMLALIIGGATGFYVWGWVYKEMVAERNYYRRLALTGTAGMRTAVRVAEQLHSLDNVKEEQLP